MSNFRMINSSYRGKVSRYGILLEVVNGRCQFSWYVNISYCTNIKCKRWYLKFISHDLDICILVPQEEKSWHFQILLAKFVSICYSFVCRHLQTKGVIKNIFMCQNSTSWCHPNSATKWQEKLLSAFLNRIKLNLLPKKTKCACVLNENRLFPVFFIGDNCSASKSEVICRFFHNHLKKFLQENFSFNVFLE